MYIIIVVIAILTVSCFYKFGLLCCKKFWFQSVRSLGICPILIFCRIRRIWPLIIIDMKLHLIQFVPFHDFCIIIQEWYSCRDTGNVKHHASHLICRIITNHTFWHICMFTVLIKDLFYGHSTVKKACFGGRINFQSSIAINHQITFFSDIIDIFCLWFQINIVCAGACSFYNLQI